MVSPKMTSPKMLKPRLDSVDSVVAPAVAALLCTVVAQHLYSQQAELYSEILSWILLPVLFRTIKRTNVDAIPISIPNAPITSPVPSRSLWIIAVGIAAASFYKAENKLITLFPALTPLLLVLQKRLQPEFEFGASIRSTLGLFQFLFNTALGTSLTALFGVVALSKFTWSIRLPESLLSLVPALALLAVYTALLVRTKDSDFLPLVDIERNIGLLAWRVVFMLLLALSLQRYAFGLFHGALTPILALSLAKALSWYFLIRTTRHTSWCIAPAVGTFAIFSTRNPFSQSWEVQALSHIVASLLALGQTTNLLPQQGKHRSLLWAFSLIPLVPYLANTIAIGTSQALTPTRFGNLQKHPVEILAHTARADFEYLLEKQSRTYTAAHDEYRRRYGIEPPPGFEAWFEFAKSHESPIIDDFDVIYETISPFLRLSGAEVQEMMKEAEKEFSREVWSCHFFGGNATANCVHPHRSFDRHILLLLNETMKGLPGVLPDIKFLVNHLDEPRVLVPPKLGAKTKLKHGGRFSLMDMPMRPVWDEVTKYCASQERRRKNETAPTVETYGLPFVQDRRSEMDLCRHPEYRDMHGLFISPMKFRPFEGLVPVLSTGAPSTMGDILFPSPAYIEPEFIYDESQDTDWDKKRNNLYWAGSTTGAFAKTDQWHNYHRHRFVTFAQKLERQRYDYLREKGGIINRVKSYFLNSRLFDVAFTRVIQCDDIYCDDQKAYFNIKPWANKDEALQSRLVFDMDGNGISGRYYKLLASNSTPLKQTLLREWHDERLVPWLHYIPVSQSLEELPELVTFLTSTEAGRARAREVAEMGRRWFGRALRDVDLTVYVYRLLLELARLQDLGREGFE